MIHTEKQKIHFNIAVAGFLDEDQAIPVYRQKITEALGQIKERVLYKEYEMFSTNPNDVRIDFYTSPIIADKFWCDVCSGWNQGDLRIVLSEGEPAFSENRFYSTANTYKTTIANSLKGISQVNTMIDWITSQIDIAVALWDGNENAQSGHIWNFIEHCKKAGIPCIWIDTTDCEKRTWFQEIYPVTYDTKALWEYIDGFYIKDTLPKEPSAMAPRMFFLSKVWKFFSAKYEKYRKIKPTFDRSKKIDGSDYSFEDSILRQTDDPEKELKPFELERPVNTGDDDFSAINANYLFLRGAFHKYEDAADRIAPFIRATLFCRTLIPLITAILLAIGFYIDSVMPVLLGMKPELLGLDLWKALAGIGFLLSAFVYIYSRINIKPHKENLSKYIVCRYVDEYLRIYIHFMAYGLPVSERILMKAIRNGDDPDKQLAAGRVRRLLRMRTPANINIDAQSCWYMFEHLNEFFDNQIQYQTTGRVLRFDGIRRNIQKWIRIFLYVNIIVLLLNAVLQFGIGLLPKDTSNYLYTKIKSLLTINDNSFFIRSFLNMIALLVAAWYEKLVREDDMNHYSGYFHIAEKILKVLKAYKARVEEILDTRKENSSVPYERIRILADDTMDSLVNELYMWCGETVSHN